MAKKNNDNELAWTVAVLGISGFFLWLRIRDEAQKAKGTP